MAISATLATTCSLYYYLYGLKEDSPDVIKLLDNISEESSSNAIELVQTAAINVTEIVSRIEVQDAINALKKLTPQALAGVVTVLTKPILQALMEAGILICDPALIGQSPDPCRLDIRDQDIEKLLPKNSKNSTIKMLRSDYRIFNKIRNYQKPYIKNWENRIAGKLGMLKDHTAYKVIKQYPNFLANSKMRHALLESLKPLVNKNSEVAIELIGIFFNLIKNSVVLGGPDIAQVKTHIGELLLHTHHMESPKVISTVLRKYPAIITIIEETKLLEAANRRLEDHLRKEINLVEAYRSFTKDVFLSLIDDHKEDSQVIFEKIIKLISGQLKNLRGLGKEILDRENTVYHSILHRDLPDLPFLSSKEALTMAEEKVWALEEKRERKRAAIGRA